MGPVGKGIQTAELGPFGEDPKQWNDKRRSGCRVAKELDGADTIAGVAQW